MNPRHPSPKLPPSVLDSFMTCVRKVNNQHPFRRTIVSSRAPRAFEILEKFCVLNMDFVDFELHFSIESSVAIINSVNIEIIEIESIKTQYSSSFP